MTIIGENDVANEFSNIESVLQYHMMPCSVIVAYM